MNILENIGMINSKNHIKISGFFSDQTTKRGGSQFNLLLIISEIHYILLPCPLKPFGLAFLSSLGEVAKKRSSTSGRGGGGERGGP